MTITKESVQIIVDALPDKITLDALFERIMLVQSFEEGRRQYQAGDYFTHEEVKMQFAEWLR